MNQPVEITQQDRAALQDLVHRPGYAVLLRLMEIDCRLQDATLLAVPLNDSEHALGQWHVCVATWGFFGRIDAKVRAEVELLHQPKCTICNDTGTVETLEHPEGFPCQCRVKSEGE